MRYLIGFGLIALGGILSAVTEIMWFLILLFIGVVLFASIPSSANFCDYIIANSNVALIKTRHYWNFLPLTIVSSILTLGKAPLVIPWKEDYFKVTVESEDNVIPVRIPRKEYVAARKEQRRIYSTQPLSKEFMESSYSPNVIGLKHKKRRLVIASVLAAIMLLMLVEPEAMVLTLIYEAVFIPMILLWIPDYKDAKILQQAYDKATSADSSS